MNPCLEDLSKITVHTVLAEFEDYRDFLDAEMKARGRKKKHLGLRSFARTLGMAPSTLSDLIAKRSTLSVASGWRLASRFRFSEPEREYFRLLVERPLTSSGSEDAVRLGKKAEELAWLLQAGEKIQEVSGHVPLEWRHFALLEWIDRNPPWDIETASEAAEGLGLDTGDVYQTVAQLRALAYTKPTDPSERYWEKVPNRVAIQSSSPNADLRSIHRSALLKAGDALSEQGPDSRFSATEFLLLDAEGYQALRKASSDALDRLHALSRGRNKRKSEIYSVCFHAYRLDREKVGKRK